MTPVRGSKYPFSVIFIFFVDVVWNLCSVSLTLFALSGILMVERGDLVAASEIGAPAPELKAPPKHFSLAGTWRAPGN